MIAAKKQHDGLNFLKGIACIIVVFLHISFPGFLGKLIGFELNFSVPIFFMISGYFAYSKEPKYMVNKAKSLSKKIIIWEIIYGIIYFFTNCILDGDDVIEFFESIKLLHNPLRVIFCGTIFNGTFWYLYAAVWVWLIYFVISKNGGFKSNHIYLLIPLLCSLHIFGRLYIQNNYDISKYVFLFRNGLVFGLPLTLFGSYIAKNKERLLVKIKPIFAILIVICGVLFSLLEYAISNVWLNLGGMDFHISTVIISFGLFIFALHFPTIKYKSLIQYIGEKLSTNVYILHIAGGYSLTGFIAV